MPRTWEFRAREFDGVTAARREFTAHMRTLTNSDTHLEAATLIFGELIANAVKYGEDPISASLESGREFARLVVEDGGSGFKREQLRAPEPTATGGRGFAIASSLARSIEFEYRPKRFRIIVELDVEEA